ncbi:hypothetical protein UCMB321_0164 [Pseudomonas batumici]|uniref:Uncharacterized protein n=1 Tax=Pseudomonas batumici TaxID=226910 RepID=A0A0C2ILK3_9PSED|nr:hypothetical protein UCMB321_0164 [Pseudomonas batumici]
MHVVGRWQGAGLPGESLAEKAAQGWPTGLHARAMGGQDGQRRGSPCVKVQRVGLMVSRAASSAILQAAALI